MIINVCKSSWPRWVLQRTHYTKRVDKIVSDLAFCIKLLLYKVMFVTTGSYSFRLKYLTTSLRVNGS